MLKPLIRTLNGWRFELPLALVLGAAVAFATVAMPHSPFAGVPVIAAHGLERPLKLVFAGILAVIAGVIGFRAMKYPWSGHVTASAVEEEADAEAPPIDVSLRLRRSDAHPDFPPREPIRASRDLGEPFMDIVGFGGESRSANPEIAYPEPASDDLPAFLVPEPAPAPVVPPIVDEAIVEKPVAEEAVAEEPAAGVAAPEPVVDHAIDEPEAPPAPSPITPSPLTLVGDAEEHPSIAAFTPESASDPVPQPERARRESLAEMMERLSAGLERRAGRPVAPPPADMLAEVLARPRAATPELRDALDELNRLAARRG